MEEIYLIGDQEYTLASLQAAAADSKMEFTDYIARVGAVKKQAEEEVEKQEATAVDAAEVVAEDVAVEENTDLESVDTSLDSPYLSAGNVGKFLGYRNSFNPTSSLEELAQSSVEQEEEEDFILNPDLVYQTGKDKYGIEHDGSIEDALNRENPASYGVDGQDVVDNYVRNQKTIQKDRERIEQEAKDLEKRRNKLELAEKYAGFPTHREFWTNNERQQKNEDERIAYEKAYQENELELEALVDEESRFYRYKSKKAYNEEIAANPLLNSKLTVDEQVAAYQNDLNAVRDLNTTDAEKARLMLQLPVPRLVNIKYDSKNQTTNVIPKPEIVNTVKSSLGVIKNDMGSDIVEQKIVGAVDSLMANNQIVSLINKTINAKYESRIEAELKRINDLPITNLEKTELMARFSKREELLENQELKSNPNLIDFRSDYTLIASEAAAKSNKEWQRSNDVILAGVDFARYKTSGVPFVAGGIDFGTSIIEGVYKAVGINAKITANQVTISSSQLGAERTASEIAMAKRMNPKDIINVEISGFYGEEVIGDIKSVDTPNGEKGFDVLDERGRSKNTADYRGKTKKMTVAAYLKYKESKAAEYKKDIITDIEDIEGYDKYAEIFQQVDWDEGMTFANAGMAVGETLPQMGITMAGAATGNPVLIALGTATMFAQEYGSMYYDTLLTGLREDLDREPTTEEIYQALEEGKYADQSEAAAFAAISTSLEQAGNLVGVSKAFKALGVTEKTGLKSLFRGEIKGFLKNTGKTALIAGESGFVEGLTEGMQQGVSQLSTGYQLGGLKGLYDYVDTDEIIEASKSGAVVGIIIPSSRSFYRQTKVETRAALTKVAVGLDISGLGENLKKAEKAFNNAVQGVDRKVEFGQITEEQGREEKEAISDVRNSTLKMPKEFYSFNESQRSAYLDAMIRKQELVRKIKNLDDTFTQEDNAELDQVNEYLRGLIQRQTGTGTKSYEVSDAIKPTEIVEEGSKEDLEGKIAATDLELSAMEQVEKMRKGEGAVARIASEVGDTDFKADESIGEGAAMEVFDTTEELESNYTTYADNQKAKVQKQIDAIKDPNSKEGKAKVRELQDQISQIDQQVNDIKRSDAFILPNGQIVINKEVAARKGAISAASHELLHKILKSEFSDKTRAVELADQFKKTLSSKELRIVQRRIDNNYRYQRDENGNILFDEYGAIENDYKDYAEEYLTSFSDAIAKKEIKWSDNLGARLWEMKEFLLSGFRKKGYTDIKFQNGRDVYNFIKDYQKNIKKDRISERARLMADAGKGLVTDTKTSKTDKPVFKDDLGPINSLMPETVNTREDYFALLDNPSVPQRILSPSGKLAPQILTYITKRTEGNTALREEIIESVRDRLINFDPKAKRADGSIVGPKGFGEFIFANTNFGRMDAKKNLAKASEKRKSETGLTDKEGRPLNIAADDTPTTRVESKKDKVTPRSKIKKAVPELITQQVEEDIEVAALEILEGVRPDPNSKEYRPFITQVLEAKLTPKMKKAFGTAKGYEFLIKKLAPKMKELLPVQYFVKLESQVKPEDRVFTNPPVDLGTNAEIDAAMDEGTVYVENNAQGVNSYTFKDFNNKDLIDFILAPPVSPTTGKKSGLRGNRKTSTAASTAIEVGRDMVVSLAEGRVSPAERALLAKKLQRDPRIKFSNTSEQIVLNSGIKFSNNYGIVPYEDYISDQLFWKKFIEDNKGINYNFKNKEEADEWIKTELPKLIPLYPRSFFIESNAFHGAGKSNNKGGRDYPFPFRDENPTKVSKSGKPQADHKQVIIDYLDANFGGPGQIQFGPDFILEEEVNGKIVEFDALPIAFTKHGQKTTKFDNYFGSKENIRNNEVKSLVLKQIFQRLQGQDDIVSAAAGMLRTTAAHQPHFMRKIAPITFRQLGLNNLLPGQITEEHALGASLVAKQGLLLAINNVADDNFTGLELNYFQGPISKVDDDLVNVKELGMKEGPQKQDLYNVLIGIHATWVRYASVPGFNLNTIQILDYDGNKSILTDYYNVGVDKKYRNNPEVIALQNRLIVQQIREGLSVAQVKKELALGLPIAIKKSQTTKKVTVPLIDDAKVMNTKNSYSMTSEDVLNKAASLDEALRNARNPNAPVKKIRVFDFDDTLARTKSNVLYTMPDGAKGKLTAEEFAKKGDAMLAEGAVWDFSEFNKVMDGKKGPLFEVAKKIQETRGTEDMFVLTARSQEASPAIKEFLDAIGLNIPAKNISGLGDSSPFAKSNWIVDKAAEGYNDFYFADDHSANVKAVSEAMSLMDVKSKTQLAKQNNIKFSKSLVKKLNWKTDEASNMTSNFKIKDKSYLVRLYPVDEKGDYRYEFELETETGSTQGITGTGNAISVFSTVYNGLVDAINSNSKIKRVEFSADKSEPSRVKVYTSVMDRLSKDLGWNTDIWETTDWDGGGSFDFEITKPRKKQPAPVEKVLNVIDVKSETQKAKIKFSMSMSEEFNVIIEQSKGIDRFKVYSDVKAQLTGARKGRFKFFIPPSAEDFQGLLYATLGKGKQGMEHMKFYDKALLKPYAQAIENLSTDRVNLMADFKALKKELDVPKDLRKTTESGFTNEQAVRVYLWAKTGQEIPGLSKTDFKELNDLIENDPKLKTFAEQILSITKGDGYSTPKADWAVGTVTTDLIEVLNTTKRGKYLETWQANVDVIFSKENMNKLEAALGSKYVEALRNSLSRMKSGRNRIQGGNKLSNQVLNYINQSTGVTMFFNTRSALLQTISAANFVNWSFNSPYHAGKAFANQPQYWKDFTMLMNSDYLMDRRNGLKLNISESEIADAAKTSKNKAKSVLNYILEKGYLPTKYADSFAIASGGAMFYRNRVNDLIKNEGKSIEEAEAQAMEEFRAVSETSQQSSDPSKISQQQSGDMGRIILQYVNTPMQYARIQKRDIQDMINKRPMPGKTLAQSNRTRLARISYYAFVQNLMFNALQQALFAIDFGDDDLDEIEKRKIINTANGMLDSFLRGLGFAGVTVQVLKNLGIDIYDRSQKSRPEYSDAWMKLLEFSPAIKTKLSKLKSAAYPFDSKKRRAEVFNKGFSLDNPAYESAAKIISATTNIPIDRLYNKINNISAALEEDTEAWQSVAMILGWSEWQIKPPKPKVKIKKSRKKKAKLY